MSEKPAEPEIQDARDMLQEHIRIRADLPKLLARAVRLGFNQESLDAILDWGEGRKPIAAIWQDISGLLENSTQQRAG